MQKRRRVVAEVKRHLERFVRPEMMRAAVSDFMAQHKFAFRGDRVVVIGKPGEADAELAAVTWATEHGESFIQRRATADSTFTAAVAKMRLRSGFRSTQFKRPENDRPTDFAGRFRSKI